MGQYYMPVIKRGNIMRRVYSHDFDNGLKLMEHSYIGNNFVNIIANELVDNPAQLYWVGDYAEAGDFRSEAMYIRICGYAWARKVKYRTTLENCNEEFDWSADWYFINQTKKQYILMPKEGDWVINPISLLTAIGNGRGGGDYDYDRCADFVGAWAGDKVYLSKEAPPYWKYEYRTDIDFGKEEW